jgi:hypothetical protein
MGAALFDALRNDIAPGKEPKPTTTAKPTLIVAPGNVRVAVFNGSGINGRGRAAATDLAGVGFQIIGPATTRGTGATQTIVYYGPTKADSAKTLAAAIPGATTQEDPSLGRTLDVVIGTDYKGVQKVTVTGTASPKPSTSSGGTPTAQTPVRTAQNNPCTT